MDIPRVAAIIPSLDGTGERLVDLLKRQTLPPDEIIVVKAVSPNGKARNQGVENTTSDILFFLDDDAVPGTPDLIEKLIQPLLEDPMNGVTGAARVLPKNVGWFQRRIAWEIPRTVNPIPVAPLETNPPLIGYGHTLITTSCCAMRRSVFEQAGRFSNTLPSGVDTDLFYRVRKLAYRFIMVPEVFVEHPAQDNLSSLLRKFYWYGLGYGQETQRRPEQKMGIGLPTPLHRILFLMAATLWLLPNIFILYSYGYPHLELGFRPFKAMSSYAVAWGYARSWKMGIR
jgi:GT2 family glycosyltransferase